MVPGRIVPQQVRKQAIERLVGSDRGLRPVAPAYREANGAHPEVPPPQPQRNDHSPAQRANGPRDYSPPPPNERREQQYYSIIDPIYRDEAEGRTGRQAASAQQRD